MWSTFIVLNYQIKYAMRIKLKNVIKTKDWGAYLIELIIVIVGVSIAFQLNVARSNSIEQKQKQFYATRLLIEIKRNIAKIEESNQYRQTVFSATQTICKYIEGDTIIEASIIDSIIYLPGNYSLASLNTEYLNIYLEAYSMDNSYEFTDKLFDIRNALEGCNSFHETVLNVKEEYYKTIILSLDKEHRLKSKNLLHLDIFYNRLTNVRFNDEKLIKAYENVLIQLIDLEEAIDRQVSENLI